MSTTLEVILKTAGFTEGATAIKKVGDEATNTNNKLKTTTSTVDQVSKSTTSLGSKLANAGKQFSGTITNVAALGSTVVNLNRQYQDLTDSQIRVDRTQLKMSKTAEAVRAAQGKLNAAVKQYGASSAEAQKAQLDLTQAQEASTLAVTMNGEAVEDQQRAYENFYMGLAPTILTAGSSITSMLKEMGGEKGIGGLVTKLKGLGGIGAGGLSGLTAALGPLALAAGVAALAIAEYENAMAHAAAGKKELELAKSAKNLAQEIEHIKKAGEEFKLKPLSNPLDFLVSIGPGGLINPLVDYFTKGKIAAAELATESDNLTKARERLNKALADPALTDWYSKEGNAARLEKTHAEEAVKLAEAKEKQIPPTSKMTSTQAALNKELGSTNSLFETMTTKFSGKSVFLTASTDVQTLANKFGEINSKIKAMSIDPVLGKFYGYLSNPNPTAITRTAADIALSSEITKLTQEALKNATASDTQKAATDALSKAEIALAQHTKDVAAAKIAAAQAAKDLQTANDNELSGINKIIAAYAELEPKVTKKGKGHVTTAVQKLPVQQAQDALKTFMQGLAPTLTTGSAEKFANDWINTAAKKIGGGASMILKPLIDYITQHKNDAPGAFASGLVDVIGSLDLTKSMQKVFLPATTASAAAAKDAGTNLSKIDTAPAVAKVKTVQVALNKILPQYKTTVTVVDKASGPAKKIKNALDSIPKLTTATIKVIPKYLGTPLGNQLVSGNLKIKQHGYQGTVKRPTTFIAGEGGRPEDVTVRPRGSVQRGGSGGGGFNGTINVYVDGVLRPARYDMGARK